jgi:succinate dehydrogenase / fumarate reductase cytochrome b subunit
MASLTRAAAGRGSVRTSVALKIMMALSGLVFVLYVIAHMYGNLKMFEGQRAFDDYAHHLRTLGEPILPFSGGLWLIRIVLVVSLVAHAYAAFALWKRAADARGTRYSVRRAAIATLSSRTMRWGGVALLLFVIFHLLQFTFVTFTVGGSFTSPYERVYRAFEEWWVVAVYLAALLALAMHLRHGVWSALQTLGFTNDRRSARRARIAGIATAAVVAGGFALPPLSILLGII